MAEMVKSGVMAHGLDFMQDCKCSTLDLPPIYDTPISIISILIPHHHHPVCRLAWATLGRDVEYAFKIGEQTIIFLTIIITN